MRNKVFKALMNCRCVIPMNLQVFAEGGDPGTGNNPGNGGGSSGNGDNGDEPQSFDDFLKTGENQGEFDRRVQEAVNAAVKDAQEKLAKMTEDEKKEYLQDKKEKDLAAREAEVTKKELMAEAKNTLAGDGLPQELAGVLDYTDADACKKSMDTVKKAFQKAVEAAVEERLKGGKPPKKATETKDEDILKQQVYNAMLGKFQ